jgi:signal transduction histidine kinase
MHKNHVFFKKCFSEITVLGVELRLEQVMVNFLTYAIKYSPDGKEIHIEMKSVANELELRITDFGIGISPALQKQLFEKYFRVEETSVRFQGLGIGLFICSEIIQRHNGYCDVESEVGKGSTFYFKIPLRSQQISEENEPIKSNL